jgi:hypothetical protein
MSVRGEFARTVAETVACLAESREAQARQLAAQLEQARLLARDDLQAAARSLLDGWEAATPGAFALPSSTEVRLGEASERMLAIARIILGR